MKKATKVLVRYSTEGAERRAIEKDKQIQYVKSENFITIQGWMRNNLKLKGSELIVYAIIYGFSQDKASTFKGSRKYLADWAGVSIDTIDRILFSLLNKKLIKKKNYFFSKE